MPAMSGRGRASIREFRSGQLWPPRPHPPRVALFGKLTVAVAANPSKAPLFTPEERVAILKESLKEIDGVEVTQFRGLVVEYCQQNGYSVILRGLRTVSDFEFEYQMALTNRALSPGVETVFVMPNEKYSYISSRLIKEVLEGGRCRQVSPPEVEARLRQKLQRREPNIEPARLPIAARNPHPCTSRDRAAHSRLPQFPAADDQENDHHTRRPEGHRPLLPSG